MGNSLSQNAQGVLEAAVAGDVPSLKAQLAGDERLLRSVTLVKRRGVLHLAAKSGHSEVLDAVLSPMMDAVRTEYYAQLEAEAAQQAASGEQPPVREHIGHIQVSSTASPQRAAQNHKDAQLPSFRRLRQAVNARDLYRRTPLIVAAKQGHLECTQQLVEAASNLFAVDREGNTALHYAGLHGHCSVVGYLLSRAADRNLAQRFVNKRNMSGFTPLHYAVWGCHEDAVAQLLAAEASLSAVNDRVFDAWVPVPIGSTPLHLAVMRNHVPIALALLQHHLLQLVAAPAGSARPPDPRNLVNLYGMNPAQLAAHRGHRQLARLLMPSLSLSRVLAALDPAWLTRSTLGPPSLKSLAAAALRGVLSEQLDALEQQQRASAAKRASCSHSAACSGGGSGRAAAGARKALALSPPADAAAAVAAAPGAEPRSAPGMLRCGMLCLAAAAGSMTESPEPQPVTPGSAAAAAGGDAGSQRPRDERSSSGCCVADVQLVAAPPAAGGRGGSRAAAGKAAGRSVSIQEPAAAAAARAPARAASEASLDGSLDSEAAASCRLASARTGSSAWYDELCCVCWEAEVTVCLAPCLHALCVDCARQLVSGAAEGGAACPLCRGLIGGFEHVPDEQTHVCRDFVLAGAGI